MSQGFNKAPASGSVVRRAWVALTAALQQPLIRNGYALAASAGLTSILGVVFWVLAARLFSPADVGVGSVLISSMVTVSAVSQLNFTNALNRFLPSAGKKAGNLIRFAYACGLLAAFILAFIFLKTTSIFVPELAFLERDPVLAIGFTAAVATWTVFALQDSALAGLRRSVWVAFENTAYSISKIILLIAIASFTTFGLGLFVAWTAPLIVFVVIVNYLIFKQFLPLHPPPRVEADLSPRNFLRFFRWDYAGSLMTTISTGVAPILVISLVGPVGSANYHLGWTIAYSLYLIGRSMGISLLTEGTVDLRRLPSLAADTFVHTMLPLTTAVILVVIFAPFIMDAFGNNYAREGTVILQILTLSTIPWGLMTIFLAVARAAGWLRSIAAAQFLTLVIVVGLGSLLLPRMGVAGIGVAWLTAHTTSVIIVCTLMLRRFGLERAVGWLMSVVSAIARFASHFARREQPFTISEAQQANAALELLSKATTSAWSIGSRIPSLSGVSVMRLEPTAENDDPDSSPQSGAILKLAPEVEVDSLERNLKRLDNLRSDSRLDALPFAVPEPVVANRVDGGMVLVEKAIQGVDGRTVLRDDAVRSKALALASQGIEHIHSKTSTLRKIDDAWLKTWIDDPVEALKGLPATPFAPRSRAQTLDKFAADQRAFWSGRKLNLGMCHGDFSPGNVLFDSKGDKSPPAKLTKTNVYLAGIIDWDRARDAAPAGFDNCHMALTTRMLVWDRELGAIVRDMLLHPEWDEEERTWLPIGELEQQLTTPENIRAMVALTWLQHVTANIEKSSRFTKSAFWRASNVDWVIRFLAHA